MLWSESKLPLRGLIFAKSTGLVRLVQHSFVTATALPEVKQYFPIMANIVLSEV